MEQILQWEGSSCLSRRLPLTLVLVWNILITTLIFQAATSSKSSNTTPKLIFIQLSTLFFVFIPLITILFNKPKPTSILVELIINSFIKPED